MTSLIHLSPLLKCLMTVCPSSLCVQVRFTRAFKGLIFPPSEPPGEIMSFGVSPVNYSDSDSLKPNGLKFRGWENLEKGIQSLGVSYSISHADISHLKTRAERVQIFCQSYYIVKPSRN